MRTANERKKAHFAKNVSLVLQHEQFLHPPSSPFAVCWGEDVSLGEDQTHDK